MPLTIWDFSNGEFFWQYPVITEKQVLTSLRELSDSARLQQHYVYLAIPWATVIDLNIFCRDRLEDRIPELVQRVEERQRAYQLAHPGARVIYLSACQHIYFARIISALRRLDVTILFASHKPKMTSLISGIRLLPLQLYAVNREDPARNGLFIDNDLLSVERPLLYSFVGFYSKNYLSRVRQQLLAASHPRDACVQPTDKWHFVDTVYRDQAGVYPRLSRAGQHAKQLETAAQVERYNSLLVKSRYSLCPSGSGPNSIRLWESLGAGAVPVILADTLDLPEIPSGLAWSQVAVRVPERQVGKIAAILGDISRETEHAMRQNCLAVYREFSGSQFARHVIVSLERCSKPG